MSNKFGFVYLWYDRKHKRYYIGSHWGTEDDGYICSSRWMRKAYRRRPEDFKRRILERIYSSRQDLLDQERYFLLMIKKNELGIRYYNLIQHVGHWGCEEQKRLNINQKISNTQKGKKRWPDGRPPMSQETKEKISKARIGMKMDETFRHRCSINTKRLHDDGCSFMRGKVWCYHPVYQDTKCVDANQQLPEGYIKGRGIQRSPSKGTKWCYDPKTKKNRRTTILPEGYIWGKSK